MQREGEKCEKTETRHPNDVLSNAVQDALHKFIRNTSFHGVQYIGSSKSKVKRAIWTVIVLGSVVALVFQIVDRIQYYYSGPVSVDVRINYNQSLKFPAVTICNQNTFRASRAAELRLHELVEHLYADTEPVTQSTLLQHRAGNMTIQDLYTLMAHQKEDMILQCQWKKRTCGPDHFHAVLTDHGVCLTFNQKDDMFVSASGVESGLRLVLNAEQYEYMTGPHDAAGVKILLHDGHETPLVYQLGEAISTGAHAFIGIKTTAIENLPGKYGGCANKDLGHTDFYSSDECYLEYMAERARDQCGCRDMYLPSLSDDLPVCSIEQYFTCFIPMKDRLLKQSIRQCDCPVPCQRTIYDTAVSYATISNLVADKLILSSDKQAVKDKLLIASEASLKIDKNKYNHLESLKDGLVYESNRLFEMIKNVSVFIGAQIEVMTIVKNDSEATIQFKDKLLQYQVYIIQKNFLRAREAMEERTLFNLVESFAEFGLIVRRQILQLSDMYSGLNSNEKRGLFNLIIDQLEVKKNINELARRNVSELFYAFDNGLGIFNYSFEDIPTSHNPYIVPKTLLKYSLQRNDLVRYHVLLFRSKVFDDIRDSLNEFIDVATNTMRNKLKNTEKVDNVLEDFYTACRKYMFSKSVVFTEALDYPVTVVQQKLESFRDLERKVTSDLLELEQNFNSIVSQCKHANDYVIPMLELLIRQIINYLNNPNSKFIELTNSMFTEGANYVRRLNELVEVLHTRGQFIQDAWHHLNNNIINVWERIINDDDMVEYYKFSNLTDFIQPMDTVISKWQTIISMFTEKNNSNSVFIDPFNSAFDNFLAFADTFRESVDIDSTFTRENIIQVDIFYRQLSFEEIKQQKAYDFFALICDIGGAMGLFIGASMLTIMEVIELVFHQITLCSTLTRTMKNRKSYTVT